MRFLYFKFVQLATLVTADIFSCTVYTIRFESEMPKHKKKFIDKHNAVTFHLVHRSQKDPLIVDETAPQHVLVQSKSSKDKEEEHKYGIFFDDDYDYMQHLKSASDAFAVWEPVEPNSNIRIKSCVTPKGKMNLPSSVFASEVEEPVGLLNKAAPVSGLCLDLDPDIVAAMDDDFDYDNPNNVLEDNFIELANQDGGEDSEDYDSEDEERDEIGSLNSDPFFEKEETKSRFTNYSLTSSVIRRNEHLTLLDDHFEKMFENYDSTAIGPLDTEEIEGGISGEDEILQRLADVTFGTREEEIDVKEKTLQAAERLNEASEEELEEVEVDQSEKWDCESILSTYSNIYNHPVKITVPKGPSKIKINKKTGVPINVLNSSRLTAEALAQLEQEDRPSGPKSIISQLSELSVRPKNESPEERKMRKQNLKIYRRERRIEKKINTEAFKEEKIRQEKVMLNFKNNQQGIKII